MPSSNFVTADGDLRVNAISEIASDPDASVSVIAALGAHGIGQSSLLNMIFDCDFSVGSRPGKQTTTGISASLYHGDSSAVQAQSPRKLVILDVEGFDGNDRMREEQRDRAASLAFSIADVVLFSVRLLDIARVETNGVSSLRVNLTEALKLEEAGIVPRPTGKRAFMIVVRDYDADVLAREELINGFLQEIQSVYESVSKPARCPTRISDLFEFEFVTLPSQLLAREAFEDAVASMGEQLVDPFSDDYLFDGGAYCRSSSDILESIFSNAWRALVEEQTRDMPPERELMSTFACDNALRKIFDKYKQSVREWERETDDGNIIEGFGSAASALMEETLSVFDQDAGPHRSSKAFGRKRLELKEKLDADLYELFASQARKLREFAFSLFKEKIDDLDSSSSDFEKEVNKALKSSQKYFTENAEKLRPRGSPWRFDNESKELANHMREDATESLQQARLEDYSIRGGRRRGRRPARSGRSARQPVSISFHYLDPAPFGWKDSRYEKLSADDPFEYNAGTPNAAKSSNTRGLSVPLLPRKDEPWDRDFVYREK